MLPMAQTEPFATAKEDKPKPREVFQSCFGPSTGQGANQFVSGEIRLSAGPRQCGQSAAEIPKTKRTERTRDECSFILAAQTFIEHQPAGESFFDPARRIEEELGERARGDARPPDWGNGGATPSPQPPEFFLF